MEIRASNDVIAKAKTWNKKHQISCRYDPIRRSEQLWKKILSYGIVYNEAGLEWIFIEGLHSSAHYSIRSYWKAYMEDIFYSLERHATSLFDLLGDLIVQLYRGEETLKVGQCRLSRFIIALKPRR